MYVSINNPNIEAFKNNHLPPEMSTPLAATNEAFKFDAEKSTREETQVKSYSNVCWLF